MRAFRAAFITLEIGLLIAAFCGFVIAASDRIEFNRKAREDARTYNASIEAMQKAAKGMHQ